MFFVLSLAYWVVQILAYYVVHQLAYSVVPKLAYYVEKNRLLCKYLFYIE